MWYDNGDFPAARAAGHPQGKGMVTMKHTVCRITALALILSLVLTVSLSGFGSAADVKEYLRGDADQNGTVNAADATRVLLHAVEKITLEGTALTCADADGNGDVNAADATRVLLHTVGKITLTETVIEETSDEPSEESKEQSKEESKPDPSSGEAGEEGGEATYDRTQDALTDKDFLKTSGTVLRNQSGTGDIVNLNGTNLGGWLHLEGWMDGGGGDNNDYAVRSQLLERFSEDEVDALMDVYQNAYITEEDLDFIASRGANCLRVPIFWMELMDNEGNMKEGAFDQIDWVIEECKERGIYIILDLHGGPGGHSSGWLTGGHSGSNELWTNSTYQAWAVTIWETIAARYKGEPAVAGYGLLNEPVAPNNAVAPVQAMYDKLFKAVRAIDEDHIIILGAFFSMDYLGDPKLHNWTNVVYESHHYNEGDKSVGGQESFAAGQASYIKQYMDRWGMPVLAGEFNFWSAESAWELWFQTLNEMNISWTSWTYKNTDKTASNYWGWYITPTVPTVNYLTDSYDTIAEKWSQYGSENYVPNTGLTDIVNRYTYYHYVDPMDAYADKLLPRSGWKVTAYRADGSDTAGKMLDGSMASRWASGEAQKDNGEQWVLLDLGSEQSFGAMLMYTPNGDAARGLLIEVSSDKETWTEVATGAAQEGFTEVTFGKQTARYVRITQTGNGPSNFWSIYELYLEKAAA